MAINLNRKKYGGQGTAFGNFLRNFRSSGYQQSPLVNRPSTSPVQKTTQSMAFPAPLSSNVSATPTKPTVISSPSMGSSFKTPAAQSFIQNQMQSQTPAVAFNQPEQKSQPKSAYLEYLNKQFNADEISRLSEERAQANKRLADIQSENERAALEARKGREAILDSSGGTLGGAQQSAQVYSRRASDDLADLALQESAAARSAQVANSVYDSYIEAGKTAYEAEQAAMKAAADEDYRQKQLAQSGQYSLSEGESRFDAQGNQIAYGGAKTSAGGGSGGGYTGIGQFSDSAIAFANQIREGKASIANVPTALRGEVAQALQSLPDQRVDELSQYISLIKEINDNPSLNKLTGAVGQVVPALGGNAATFRNQYKQLKGILSLEGRQKLKGSGAISDFEFRVLENAASALGRNLTVSDFQKELKKVSDILKKRQSQLQQYNSYYGQQSQSGGGTTGVTPSGIRYTVVQ